MAGLIEPPLPGQDQEGQKTHHDEVGSHHQGHLDCCLSFGDGRVCEDWETGPGCSIRQLAEERLGNEVVADVKSQGYGGDDHMLGILRR